MRSSYVSTAVSALLMNAAKAEGSEAGATDPKSVAGDGTMITEGLKTLAREALAAAWEIQDKVRNVSQMVLGLAKAAVRDAKGDLEVAVKKFNSAISDAEAAHMETHGKTKAQKAKVEEFLATGSIWRQYVSNINAGLKSGFDPSPYKTESAYRTARQNASKQQRTVKGLRDQIGDVLDIKDLTDAELLEFAKDNENKVEDIIEALREEGFEDAPVDEEKRAKRLFSQSEADAAQYFRGVETAITKPREALATIMRTCAAIDWNGEHGEDATRELSNCLTKLLKFTQQKPQQQTQVQRSRAVPPQGQQANVQNL